jgi:hypothetical protein
VRGGGDGAHTQNTKHTLAQWSCEKLVYSPRAGFHTRKRADKSIKLFVAGTLGARWVREGGAGQGRERGWRGAGERL